MRLLAPTVLRLGRRGADHAPAENTANSTSKRTYSGITRPGADEKEVTAMDETADDKWLTRQDLADRYGLPVKTPAEWASKGTGPRYAKFGRHVRYRLSDVLDWESRQFADGKRDSA